MRKPSQRKYKLVEPGDSFGRLTVLREGQPRLYRGCHQRRWWCRCSCGNEKLLLARSLKAGRSQSCGCLGAERRTAACVKALTKHGHALSTGHSPEYGTYTKLVERCYNPKLWNYTRWGGRGITVCDRWLGEDGFINFLADMGLKPDRSYQIERRNNDKGYSPDNCCWATPKQQARNRRSNKLITYNGITHCLAEWSELLGINYGTLQQRLKSWSVEDAFTKPLRSY